MQRLSSAGGMQSLMYWLTSMHQRTAVGQCITTNLHLSARFLPMVCVSASIFSLVVLSNTFSPRVSVSGRLRQAGLCPAEQAAYLHEESSDHIGPPACRRTQLEQALQSDQLTDAEKQKQREDFEKREREYTRFQRTRMTAADFEPLTVIGRGAFGEVCLHGSVTGA